MFAEMYNAYTKYFRMLKDEKNVLNVTPNGQYILPAMNYIGLTSTTYNLWFLKELGISLRFYLKLQLFLFMSSKQNSSLLHNWQIWGVKILKSVFWLREAFGKSK